mgnify:CR=1 FL=1
MSNGKSPKPPISRPSSSPTHKGTNSVSAPKVTPPRPPKK